MSKEEVPVVETCFKQTEVGYPGVKNGLCAASATDLVWGWGGVAAGFKVGRLTGLAGGDHGSTGLSLRPQENMKTGGRP